MLLAPGPGSTRNKRLCSTSQSASKFTACNVKEKSVAEKQRSIEADSKIHGKYGYHGNDSGGNV
jgi:hypothetical protein